MRKRDGRQRKEKEREGQDRAALDVWQESEGPRRHVPGVSGPSMLNSDREIVVTDSYDMNHNQAFQKKKARTRVLHQQ